MKPIIEIANDLGIQKDELEPHGSDKAKVRLEILERISKNPCGKYILVTAVNPTPFGEGKTVTTIGLSQALARLGKRVATTIRQPSMGPVFGIKGGGTGGGKSQAVPASDINFHFTGDIPAVSAAHNLLAAFIDTSILKGNPTGLDSFSITWRRAVDMSDRALRRIVTGLGGRLNGVPRETGFDITAASEIMAVLALTSGLADMRERLGRIVVGFTGSGKPVTASELGCAGAMAVLLKDAIKPNLVQTLEETPCFVHAGPFANIAHGNSSVIADRMALRLADYTVTEAGFGADCGMEKFFNIKCRTSGLRPDAVVIVATVRALKMHSDKYTVKPGKPLEAAMLKKNVADVEAGADNLAKHIENAQLFGVPVVVAVNRFETDHADELKTIVRIAGDAGALAAVVSEVFQKGGEGGQALAEAVTAAADKKSDFKLLYETEWPIKKKIETIATRIYGAKDVYYSVPAEKKIRLFESNGFGGLPVCMAKTQFSLSHDAKLMGRPTGFTLPINEVRASIGAGFLYPLCGTISTMPGLPAEAAAKKLDLDADGNVVGLT
jgi:formate--tetrahydrofolate ligase